jgi:hypothetical protein
VTHKLARFSISAKEDPLVRFMPLRLAVMKSDEVIGIYGKNKNIMPARALYLHPDAAKSYREHLSEHVQISDMLRSAESSLNARRRGRGAQRPGYSGHNFGLSIDLAVSKTIKRMGLKNKRALDGFMNERGWYCHRRDHKREFEEWHYNFFGDEHDKYVRKTDRKTSAGIERKMTEVYGRWWHKMSATDAQRGLTRLGMYDGDLDGIFGPLSKEATRVFQRAWLLKNKDGKLDTMIKRTLAFVTADRVLV